MVSQNEKHAHKRIKQVTERVQTSGSGCTTLTMAATSGSKLATQVRRVKLYSHYTRKGGDLQRRDKPRVIQDDATRDKQRDRTRQRPSVRIFPNRGCVYSGKIGRA